MGPRVQRIRIYVIVSKWAKKRRQIVSCKRKKQGRTPSPHLSNKTKWKRSNKNYSKYGTNVECGMCTWSVSTISMPIFAYLKSQQMYCQMTSTSTIHNSPLNDMCVLRYCKIALVYFQCLSTDIACGSYGLFRIKL